MNPRVSLYWLWLVVAFGGIALVPWHRYPLTGRLLPVATVYVNPGMEWQPVLVGHSLVSVLIAIVATVAHHLVHFVRSKALAEPLTFSVRRMLVGVAAVGGLFSILACCRAPPLVFLVVLLSIAGYPASLALTALVARGAKRMQNLAMNRRDWSRAYYTVFALSVLLIPATTYVGVRYAAGTVRVAEAWGWRSAHLHGFHLQAYYRVGWVGYSLFGIVPLLVIAALAFRRTRGWSTCLSAILLAASVLFYLRGVFHCCSILHCVVEGTLIATPLGDVPVETLHVGDQVWSVTEESVLGLGKVEAIASFSVGGCLEIVADDGSTLRVTGTQPVATTESWTLASRLKPGDRLRTMDSTIEVTSVTRLSQPVTVYDLTVEPGHSFFAGGVLVHNKILSLTSADESPFNGDLVRAVQFNDPAGVQAALNAGADPSASTGSGTVLHIAVDAANVEVCRMLIEAGADLTRVDADGRTPTMVAMTKFKRPSAEYWDEEERQKRHEIRRMLEAADPAGEEALRGLRQAIDVYYAAAREQKKEARDAPEEAAHDPE